MPWVAIMYGGASGGEGFAKDNAQPSFYTLIESHVIAIPRMDSGEHGFPVELGVDLAPYLKSGRRI
mgnify:CR=1 FL=1